MDRTKSHLRKKESDVLKQLKDVENALPFPLSGFDPDNGSEFLNQHLLRHFSQRKQPVRFTRTSCATSSFKSLVHTRPKTRIMPQYGLAQGRGHHLIEGFKGPDSPFMTLRARDRNSLVDKWIGLSHVREALPVDDEIGGVAYSEEQRDRCCRAGPGVAVRKTTVLA